MNFSYSVLASVVLVSGAASADVLWKGDFETNDLSQWTTTLNQKTGQRTNITVVESPVQQGAHAAQLVVHPDDLWPNGHNRVELHQDGKRTQEGQTTYFSWCFELPKDITLHEDIGYWETWGPYQQSMAFYVDPAKNGGMQLGFRTNWPESVEHWSAPLGAGVWHQIAMEILWTQSAANGRVSVWFDGAPVVDQVAAQTKPNDADLFLQLGYHRDASQPSVDTIFIDGAREGTTLDDVLDKPRVVDAGSDEIASIPDASTADGTGSPAPLGSGGANAGGGGGMAESADALVSNRGSAGGESTGSADGSDRTGAEPPAPATIDSGCGCRFASEPRAPGLAWMSLLLSMVAGHRRQTLKRARAGLVVSRGFHSPSSRAKPL